MEGEDGGGLAGEARDDRFGVALDAVGVDGVDLHRGADRDQAGQAGAHAGPGPEAPR